MPNEEFVLASVEKRFEELSKWIQFVPNSSELIGRAADRVFAKRAPSHREGIDSFKDCLIWEAFLFAAQGRCAAFVSAHVALNGALATTFIDAMNEWNIEQLHDPSFSLQSFLTEKPGIAHVEFVAEAAVTNTATIDGQVFQQPKMQVEGSCSYDPHGPIRDLQVSRVALIAADGRELRANQTIFARGLISLGVPRERFSLKSPLSGQARTVKTNPRN